MSDVTIKPVPFRSVPAQMMIDELMADLSRLYGGTGDDTPIAPGEFDPPLGEFLVAFQDELPVGCGGWRTFGGGGTVAELKRMYVTPAARGRGIGRSLLTAVEDSARGGGRTRLILETGHLQPEAIALYQRSGYVLIENFGHYRDAPGVHSFGRDL